MLKRAAVFPFLFILDAILTPLLQNIDQIDPAQAVRPLATLMLLAALSMFVLVVLLKDTHYAGYLVLLALVFFCVFSHLNHMVQDIVSSRPGAERAVLLLVWGILLAVLGYKKIWRRFGGAGLVTPLLNLVVASALIIQLITYRDQLRRLLPQPLAEISSTVVSPPGLPLTGDPVTLDCTHTPDIYYIILDAYGRADVLERLYGVDTAPFLAYLERKGFTIARQSHSNYIQTALSIPSALDFTYLSPEPEGTSGAVYYRGLIASNRLDRLLETCGYETVAFKTGFYFTNQLDVDVTLSSRMNLSEFESLLLAGSPLDVVAARWISRLTDNSYPAHRQRVLYTFQQLQKLPGLPGPKFVFAHIVSPHPPFVFDANGRPLEPGRDYSIGDGNDFGGDWQEYRRGYAGQVSFVDSMLEKTIDAILLHSPTPPVIVIQGDHGPGGFLDWGSLENSCLWERTSILNAYYLPGLPSGGDRPAKGTIALNPAELIYPSITPVNSFRLILNAYFGAGLELLPDRTYYSSQLSPRQITEITWRRDSTQNCPP